MFGVSIVLLPTRIASHTVFIGQPGVSWVTTDLPTPVAIGQAG